MYRAFSIFAVHLRKKIKNDCQNEAFRTRQEKIH